MYGWCAVDNIPALAQAIGYNSEEDVIQNLKDAGCDQGTIESFKKCMDRNDLNGQLRLLEGHRKCLLDRVHEENLLPGNGFCLEEKQIDCLDYLVYQIERSRIDS